MSSDVLGVVDQEAPSINRAALAKRYRQVRHFSHLLCEPLAIEDHCIQSMPDVSPAKWHLAHTTWFFETFVLKPFDGNYRPFDPEFEYLFNSYYNAAGAQFPRPQRGLLSRPTVREVQDYRIYVDYAMTSLLERWDDEGDGHALAVTLLGLHHEQQHQELILTDIKHVFSINPLAPVYRDAGPIYGDVPPMQWKSFDEGVEWIGYGGDEFAYDNEGPRHREFVDAFALGSRLVTNLEFQAFIEDDGYRRPELWLSDGWAAVRDQQWGHPLYWRRAPEGWLQFTLHGLVPLNGAEPVCHVSYFEADAYARWADARLPTEAEWEVAARAEPVAGNLVETERFHPVPLLDETDRPNQMYGDVWEWTQSPYTAYPGYRAAEGALGEYNGKFMCNQMILRGGSCATSISHIRPTYRNFFAPAARWQFSGLRLARHV
jgi:ergothioneine biosynthesis protein EgtB